VGTLEAGVLGAQLQLVKSRWFAFASIVIRGDETNFTAVERRPEGNGTPGGARHAQPSSRQRLVPRFGVRRRSIVTNSSTSDEFTTRE
jgi:hypothetical protein